MAIGISTGNVYNNWYERINWEPDDFPGQLPLEPNEMLISAIIERWDAFSFFTPDGRPADDGNSFLNIGEIGRTISRVDSLNWVIAFNAQMFTPRPTLTVNSAGDLDAINYNTFGGNYQGNSDEDIAITWTVEDILLDIDPLTTETDIMVNETGQLMQSDWPIQMYNIINRFLWTGVISALDDSNNNGQLIISEDSDFPPSPALQEFPRVFYIEDGTGDSKFTFKDVPFTLSDGKHLADIATVVDITLAELNVILTNEGAPALATSITSQESGTWVAQRVSAESALPVAVGGNLAGDIWSLPNIDDPLELYDNFGWNLVATVERDDLTFGNFSYFGDINTAPVAGGRHTSSRLPVITVRRADTNNILEFTDPDITPSDDLILPTPIVP